MSGQEHTLISISLLCIAAGTLLTVSHVADPLIADPLGALGVAVGAVLLSWGAIRNGSASDEHSPPNGT